MARGDQIVIRRPTRRPLRYQQPGSNRTLGQRPPLPSSAVEYWHSELQCTAATWTGQILGLVLPGVNTPTVATDAGFFRGRPVGKTATSGNRVWRGNPLVGLPAAGSRPWVMLVARLRAIAGTQQIISMGFDAATTEAQLFASATFFAATFSGSGNLNSTVASDTAVHRLKAWRDGTNRNVQVDGTLTSSADVGVSIAVNTIALGCQSNAAGGFADADVAFAIICSAKPSAAEEAALDGWAQSYWGST